MPNRSKPCFSSKAFPFIFVLFLQLNVWGFGSFASGNIRVSVDPEHNVIMVNESFIVNVSIANVPQDGLYSYELRLKYDSIVLESINVTLPEGHFLTPEQPDEIFVVECRVNQTEEMVYVAVTLLGGPRGKVGSGTLVTIAFKAKAPGISSLSFPFPYPILVPPYSVAYENVDVFEGFVTVVSPDLNSDEEVNIEDLVIVATAFMSYPGHPDWNPLADFNKDNIINIVDLALIARNFGKTFYVGQEKVYKEK